MIKYIDCALINIVDIKRSHLIDDVRMSVSSNFENSILYSFQLEFIKMCFEFVCSPPIFK